MLHILTGVMLLRQAIRCFALAKCFTVQFCISVISQIIVAIAADLCLFLIFLELFFLQKMEALKEDNKRLKEENGALIRVISKLSK